MEFVAEAAGAGLLQGATSGFAQGLEWGLIGRAATTFVPLPGVGQVIGGYQAVVGLAEKDWSAAGKTIANFGEGGDTYEVLANSIASVAEIVDIITQVMSFGSPTPVEVAVQGPALAGSRAFAEKLRPELAKVASLRDLQYAQPLDYPSLQINIDRNRAGQFGVTSGDVARSLVAAT